MATRRERTFDAAARRAANTRTRIIRDTRGAILALLRQAEAEIQLALSQQPEAAENWRLAELQREVRRAMEAFARDAATPASQGAEAAWSAGQALVDAPLRAVGVSLQGLAPALDTRALEAMRSFLTEKIRGISIEAADRVNTQLGLTIVGARSPFEAAREVARILGESTRERATLIVRTELARVFGIASQRRLAQAAEHVPGMRKRWRRSGKVHSRWNHDLADGQTVAWGEPFVLNDGKTPGAQVKLMHPGDPKGPPGETINCGCVLLPVLPESEGLVPTRPAKRPFSDEELRLNRRKAELADAVPLPRIDRGRGSR